MGGKAMAIEITYQTAMTKKGIETKQINKIRFGSERAANNWIHRTLRDSSDGFIYQIIDRREVD